MKTEVKKIDSLKREIDVEVTGQTVTEKFNDVFQRIAKEAKVPGFRPGHAPREIVEKHFSGQAHEQVLKELIPSVYNEAIDKEGLDVVELPEISEVKLDRSRLSFKATVSVSPQINIKNYKKIKLNFRSITVTPEEIKRHLDSFLQSRKLDKADDSFARGLGYPNIGELEKAIERQIFINKENQERQRIENEIIDNLLGGLDFKVPHSLVERQIQDMIRQAKVNLAMSGLNREQIEEREKTLRQEIEPEARKQVMVYLVLAEIAKKEGINIDEHMPRRVMEFLLKEADWQQ